MINKNLSNEIISLFGYMRDVVCKKHKNTQPNEYTYILSILNNEDSLAYKALSSIVMVSTLEEMKEHFDNEMDSLIDDVDNIDESYSKFDKYFTESISQCERFGIESVTSSILLLSILKENENIAAIMKMFSVTTNQLSNAIKSQVEDFTKPTALVEIPKRHTKKNKIDKLEMRQPIKVVNTSSTDSVEIDNYATNFSKLALLGKVQKIVGYEKYYDQIFTILNKKNRNNVAVCGKSGVGKTAMVKNLANIINDKNCNKNFHNKILVGIDFSKLVIGTPFKGAFEQKFYNILDEAKQNGNYIFFIDNIHFLLNERTKYAETDIETLLETLFGEPSIQTICTTTEKSFSNIQKKTSIGKYLQEVIIEEPNDKETFDILTQVKSEYESYHDVSFTDKAITSCIELSRKYIPNRALPDSALDLMDTVGAKVSLKIEENPKVKELKEKLLDIISQINEIKHSSETKQYDEIDNLTKQQIAIKSQIGIIEKEEILDNCPIVITENDVCSVLSEKIDIPLEDITVSEKEHLKGLNGKLKESIIGQDEAIDEVCRAVKRQRIGLGETNRPSVLMFLGSTGTGKTYLAKQLAKEVFGDEKYFVRMDMSEYSDKTSVNKISGSSPGYIGYDNDTFLVKALKNKKRFILLLDEFEKSNEEIHNIFLQMFDEGRFTDNHGIEYSLKDVIIIMTSNVGVAEAANRGNAIGFCKNDYDFSKSIIEKELKRKFKPEFLNRIQKIVYFNKLSDDNIKNIIRLEIQKLNNKVQRLGYHLSEDITSTKMVNEIYSDISSTREYGARPIVNEIQRKIEDKIVDFIIENDVEEGHTFTYSELTILE